MVRHLFTYLLISCFTNASGQTPAFISGTSWFVSNNDNSFFKTDTVRLIKYATKDKYEDEASFFGGDDFLTLSLQKNKALRFQTHLVESWTVSEKKGKYQWKFDNQSQELNLYFHKNLFGSFILLSTKPIKVKSKFAGEPSVNTIEVTMKRMTTANTSFVK